MIVPAILTLYAVWQERNRLRSRYGLKKDKEILASDPLGSRARGCYARPTQWDATEAVEKYQEWLEEKRAKEKS